MIDVHAIEEYSKAVSLAKKSYQRSKAQGESGHLTALDGLLKEIDIISTVHLGTMNILLKKVKGTYTKGRRMTFAKNFMPLESRTSEFATKWIALCEAHLTEGIRDPIKVYEYMGFYYVMEGNKRVSVLKYYDAVSIDADVTRIVPKYDEESELHQIYYAYMSFYQVTGLHQLWFSKKSRFGRLLRYLEKFEAPADQEKFVYFYRRIYEPFRSKYLADGGGKLENTTADAFILYAQFYGVKESTYEELSETMPRLIKELSAYGDPDAIDISVDDDIQEPPSIISPINMLLKPFKKLRVAFIYARTIEKSGWTYSHELGRQHVESIFGSQVTTAFVENVPEDDSAYDVIKGLAEENYDVIFTTSEIFMKATMRCAMENPTVKFFNCSESRPFVHMSNYFGRTYEPRFLTGMIAGSMTKTDIIGYAATSPTSEVIAGINAFTLGAKMVNPRAIVQVAWTNDWNHPEKTKVNEQLAALGADIINNKTLAVPREETWKYGVYAMLCEVDPVTRLPKTYLASPIWHWGVFYEKIINSILSGTYRAVTNLYNDNPKLINYWWGLASGALDIYLNKSKVPADTVKLVELMKKMMIQDMFHPFTGPIYDSKGVIKVESDDTLSVDEILNMDWFVDGVITHST
ncbi:MULTISPECIES: BMP family ABC transporter substrate-binding protein [unclassified Fusibacter]|uniref:BMP family ABC transporter substrate-binding protein n=1 Tax=unclassified Fusibacter TaxID=2624464 RepID=UPI0010126194|nr:MULTISPECIES: BMP family ABC transporter substrate-binding protein [unclassified Fusibacter]MCK8059199.1 BMP family ABC transporter substrate-binding protein [Fusibacter sp. A2]NPE21339.1 BMP family ABC transporter substrate-binding protein [Fusibacter sp. A1]RXV62600.1 BMP family ABC transporter substrate-binding protein [Fusibacter sp. A1]